MTINRYILSSEFCESVRDGTHDTPKQTNSGYRLVTSKHIKNGQINSDEGYFISEKDFKKINERSLVDQWDVLMSMIGTIGEAAIVKDQPKYAIKNVALFKCGDELKAKWLYYFLCSPEGKGQLFSNQKGASQQFVSLTQLRNLQIPIRDQSTMKKITDILSAYDYLIENNQKQIRLLEEAAMRLYKEWFVNLRFPGYENTKIIDGVPEGWSRKKLIDIADITMGQSPKSEYYNDRQQGLPFHQGVTNYGYRFVIDETYSTSYTRIAEAGSVLFSVRAPVGRMNITKNKIVIGRGLAAINHREGLQSFLFYMLKNRFYKDDLIGNGAIYASITKAVLHSQEFLIPCDNLANEFNNVAKSIDQQITNADRQIILLQQARDKLLPKLMNGDIEV